LLSPKFSPILELCGNATTQFQAMQYTLLSPTKITRRKDGPFQSAFEISIQYQYPLIEHGIEIKKPINTFYKSTPIGKYQAEIKGGVTPLTKEVAETYLEFQSIIGHCITNGEDINNQLRELLLGIKELNHSEEEILKMDFMVLRDVFRDFLDKYTDIHNESNFNSKDQRKGMTKLMFSFITDRNIYTHGVLHIQRPEEVFVIDYIENKKEKARVEVTLQVLESFLQISDLLKNLLNEIGAFYRKTKRKAQS
jgi:hypothetical protein